MTAFSAARAQPRASSHQNDSLTGLSARSAFVERIDECARRSSECAVEVWACCINLDRFRLVNRLLGYETGNRVLIEVASLLVSVCQSPDDVCRIHSDSFAVILPRSVHDAKRWAGTVLRLIEMHLAGMASNHFVCTASAGIARLNGQHRTAEASLRGADWACRQSKLCGGNQVQSFHECESGFDQDVMDAHWCQIACDAMADRTLHLFAQPIVATDGNPAADSHCEVLIGLDDGYGRRVPADRFLPALQRMGFSAHVDRYVVDRIIEFLCGAKDAGQPPQTVCAINLDCRNLSNARFRKFVRESLSVLTRPDLLCFEITETEVIANMQEAKCFIREMRELGCRIALDDFGSGYCSYHYLKQLPVDFLKIDGQFVRQCNTGWTDYSIVDSIHRLARRLGLRTVAEFVENQSIYDTICNIGIDFGQGYYLGTPALLSPSCSPPNWHARG